MRRLVHLTALVLLVPLLPVPGTAHASPAPAPSPAVRRADPDVRLTAFRFRDVVMNRSSFDGIGYLTKVTGVVGTTFSPGSDYQPVANAVTTRLRVNGTAPRDAAFTNIGFQFVDAGHERVGTFVPHSLGPGRYVVGPLNLAITTDGGDRDVALDVRDTFFVRQPTVAGLTARRTGARVTLRVTAQVRYWKTWKLVRASPRVQVERRVGGRWRPFTTVPLGSAGKGVKVVRAGTRYRYRVRVAQTPTRVRRVAVTGLV